jgi:hypothetical protein
MKETIAKAIKYYIRFGLLYGTGRNIYWLGNLNDKTYTNDSKNVYHRPTLQTMCYYTLINSAMSQMFWPFFMLSDYSVYEKSKIGIRDLTPPYPFETLHWKEDREYRTK